MDTDTAVCVNMWAPGTPARSLCTGSVETLARIMEPKYFLFIAIYF